MPAINGSDLIDSKSGTDSPGDSRHAKRASGFGGLISRISPSALYRRFFLTSAVTSFVVAVIAVWVSIDLLDRVERQHSQRQFRSVAQTVLKNLSENGFRFEALAQEFERLKQFVPGLELYVLDDQGLVQISLGTSNAGCCGQIDLAPIRKFLSSGDEDLPILMKSYSFRGLSDVFSAAQFEYEGRTQYLLLLPGSAGRLVTVRTLRENYGIFATVILVAVLAVLATATAAFTLSFLARRFTRLVTAVEKFASGDLSSRIQDPERDEIGTLAESFNTMADRLSETVEQLSRRDSVRRELIADISHDLRRPLQLLRLCVDGIVSSQERGTVPGPAIVGPLSSNLNGLQRLLDELFELAKLEGRETPLELIPLELSDFITEVTERFQPLASSKQITLKAEGADSAVMVVAQPELLERALGNLIENAVRHTASGGSITARITVEPAHATVSIVDTGYGISPEDKERLFDRYAQGAVQHDAHTGCGLGLAIVRKIVEAHQSTVKVQSALGEGTSFSFSLALKTSMLLVLSLCISPANLRAEPPGSTRVTVYRAEDPKDLELRERRCPELISKTPVTGADLRGTAIDELVLRSREGQLSAVELQPGGCTGRVTELATLNEKTSFSGALDADKDGRDELYFYDAASRELIKIRILDDRVDVSNAITMVRLPYFGELKVALVLPGREPAILNSLDGAVAWSPFDATIRRWKAAWPPLRSHIVGVVQGVGYDSILASVADWNASFALMNLAGNDLDLSDSFWADFSFADPMAVSAGDFNGDGETDLLAQLPGILGIWARTADSNGQLEYPVATPRPVSLADGAVGDFDGDGMDELVLAPIGPSGELTLVGFRHQQRFPAAQIMIDGVSAGQTGPDGTLEVPLAERPRTIQAVSASYTDKSAGRTLLPSTRRLTLLLRDAAHARTDGSAYGATRSSSGPRICLGYLQSQMPRHRRWTGAPRLCPDNHAVFSFDDGSSAEFSRQMTCCRLPADDILTQEHLFVSEICPDDSIMTGMTLRADGSRIESMRCTKINTERYLLSAPQPGRYWGSGMSFRSFNLAQPWHEIPLGIRYAIGRISPGAWDVDGCIGHPPGALLIGGRLNKCETSRFSILHEKHASSIAPVKMFPDCIKIANLLDPRSGCVTAPQEGL